MASDAMATAAMDPAKLPVPVRMTGIGNSSIEITSSSAEAKMWFEQGLNLLHDFWDYESAKAFEQSVRLDPKCAMCWWGLAQAESFRGGSDTWGEQALDKALTIAKTDATLPQAERLYIWAAEEGSLEAKAQAAMGAMKAKPGAMGAAAGAMEHKVAVHEDSEETKTLRILVGLDPKAVQPRIFLAESLRDGFEKDGTPKAGTAQGQAILIGILKEYPEDTAANHYWIHAMEPGLHPELALESARKLGPLTPASGHMVHMPGHIFYRVGDYETARVSFENSMRVDEGYMKVQGVPVEDDWNYVHNLMYLIADLMEAGRIEEATAMSGKLVAAHGTWGASLYRQNARDGISRLNAELPVALRSGDWVGASAMLTASKPEAGMVNLVKLRAALLDYTEGMAALEAKDTAKAASLSDALKAVMKADPETGVAKDGGMPGMQMGGNDRDEKASPVKGYMGVAALELEASVAQAQGKTAEADATFDRAAAAEKDLGYREPPFYIRPVGETRGDALLRAGRYGAAKTAYEAALADRPNSGYPLYGIARAEAASGDTAGAKASYERLVTVWAKGDPGLPQVTAAKSWLAGHGGVAAGE
jgi:tetratricopeptide (TPR) repeat protein